MLMVKGVVGLEVANGHWPDGQLAVGCAQSLTDVVIEHTTVSQIRTKVHTKQLDQPAVQQQASSTACWPACALLSWVQLERPVRSTKLGPVGATQLVQLVQSPSWTPVGSNQLVFSCPIRLQLDLISWVSVAQLDPSWI